MSILESIHQSENPGYRVETPVYEGPLDLLLQLIERAELDITKLALAHVTNHFLGYIRQLQTRQAEEVSGFLVIAARLMQIKSEALLPRPPEREPGEEDPSEELIQQLLAYKRYKEIANILKDRETQGLRSFLRMAPPPKIEPQLDMEDVTLNELFQAAKRAFELVEEKKPLATIVRAPKVTISEKINLIHKTLKDQGRSNFQTLLGKDFSRVDIVVTFLALLELIKRFRIQVVQDSLFSEIEIELSEEWTDSEDFDIEFSE